MKRHTFLSCSTALLLAMMVSSSPRLGEAASARNPAQDKATLPHFQTSDRCFACHNQLQTANGEDISIGFDWRASMMANSSRDPYWQGSVRRETIDHPESKADIEDECAICHMPMARYESKLNGKKAEIFANLPFNNGHPGGNLAIDGVSCSLCHQISKEKLGTRESFVGGFVIDALKPYGQKPEYGPYKIDEGNTRIMRSSSDGFHPTEGQHIRSSEVCATCHTLITKALGPNGQEIGSLPEQVPYQEWLHSDFKDKQSCQSCHMPEVKDVPITRVLGTRRESLSRHVFVGANYFMQRILNRYSGDLGVWALPQELSSAADRTVQYLQEKAARLSIGNLDVSAGRLRATITVQNLGGHKFPTGYPSRRTWLHVTIKDRNGDKVFESGAINPDGSITGNDNDADPLRVEPHYNEITSSDQVQIYESVMVDRNGSPTTGLLNAVRFVKDNRLLPAGFNKQTADPEIAVLGEAAEDADFVGGSDMVRYSASTGSAQGPFQIEAELCYQPISYRWANNLAKYEAAEPKRFGTYFNAMSSTSSVAVFHASAVGSTK